MDIVTDLTPTGTGPCPQCGKNTPQSPVARFCSDECADIAFRQHNAATRRTERLLEWEYLWTRSVVGRDLSNMRLEDFERTQAVTDIETCFGPCGLKSNVALRGEPGRGKSMAARYALMRSYIDYGQSVCEVSARRLMRDGDRLDIWRQVNKADVLLIDDIDKSVWTEQAVATFWEVCELLNRRRGRVIITGNVSLLTMNAEIVQKLGKAHDMQPAYDRLLPMVGIKVVGENLRREKKS
jgi:DNA replication protein DnaC